MSFPTLSLRPYLITFRCSCSGYHGIMDQLIDSPSLAGSRCAEQRTGGSQTRASVPPVALAQPVVQAARPAHPRSL